MLRRRDLPRRQISRNRREVIERPLTIALQRGLVPGRAELAAATDVGDDISPALLQPQLAKLRLVNRRVGYLETAIAEHHGRG
jgi:hypothetical protein